MRYELDSIFDTNRSNHDIIVDKINHLEKIGKISDCETLKFFSDNMDRFTTSEKELIREKLNTVLGNISDDNTENVESIIFHNSQFLTVHLKYENWYYYHNNKDLPF